MKIIATNETIWEIARSEAKRIDRLIELEAIKNHGGYIDMSHIDVSKVTNFSYLFINIKTINQIDLDSWDLSNAEMSNIDWSKIDK